MCVLIYGSTGWIGNQFISILKKVEFDVGLKGLIKLIQYNYLILFYNEIK